jgi:hypothetical protein
MSVRLESLQTRLDQYILCETAITTGAQEYAIGTRRLTRANLKEISDMILEGNLTSAHLFVILV